MEWAAFVQEAGGPQHSCNFEHVSDTLLGASRSWLKGSDMRYGYIGSMKVKPGHRAEVVAVLVAGADGLRKAGCHLYVVTESATDEDTVWVSEVWESKEHHDASLQLPEAKASISKVMPLLTGEFTRQETCVAGGLGI